MHTLSRWVPPSGAVDTVISALVLLCKMRCMVHVLFHCQDLFVGSLREKCLFLFLTFARPLLWRPLIFCIPCLVGPSLISCLIGKTNFAFHLRHYGIVFG